MRNIQQMQSEVNRIADMVGTLETNEKLEQARQLAAETFKGNDFEVDLLDKALVRRWYADMSANIAAFLGMPHTHKERGTMVDCKVCIFRSKCALRSGGCVACPQGISEEENARRKATWDAITARRDARLQHEGEGMMDKRAVDYA